MSHMQVKRTTKESKPNLKDDAKTKKQTEKTTKQQETQHQSAAQGLYWKLDNSNNKTLTHETFNSEKHLAKGISSNSKKVSANKTFPESLTKMAASTSSTLELTQRHISNKKYSGKIYQDFDLKSNKANASTAQDKKYSNCKSLEDKNSLKCNLLPKKRNEQILTQNGMNKSLRHESMFKDHPFNKSIGECSQKIKRAVSRCPKQNFNKENDEIDKKDSKLCDEKKEASRTTTVEGKSKTQVKKKIDNFLFHDKPTKEEQPWKFEKDVMWTSKTRSGKRAGFLIFNCAYINQQMKNSIALKYGMAFKFSQADSKLIRILLEAHGLKEVNTTSGFFNLYWGNVHFSPNELRQLQEWQKVNHFPRSSELTRKDRLYMNIKRMQRQFGVKLFNFIPTSFLLPTEHRDFCDTHLRERGTWIVKPVASSQGKGIYLVSQVDQVPADETSLVCRYLDSPLLVDGYKCDLRLYVAVTSLDPLIVYLYEEGLVRLATIKYQHGKNLWNPCIHLTNYSVNKFHSNYVQNEDAEVDDRGNKWSLSAFLRHLKARGVDTGSLMRSIEDVIIKSILSASYQMNTATNMFVPHFRNCFELYGFDILIDNQLKPWVLEVNLSPSLNVDQPLDLKIKSAMLSDLFSLVGIEVCNPTTSRLSTKPSIYRKLPNLRHSAETLSMPSGGHFGINTPKYVSPSAEEVRLFKQIREENERKGGWARIFPTPDSWAMYGSLQEYDSPLNLFLHLHFYPNVQRNSRFVPVAPLKVSSVSSSGLASSLERLSCYERALPKDRSLVKSKLDPRMEEETKVCRDIRKVKASLVDALESGISLSKYQARMAFSAYLQHVQRRLMIGCDREQQTDLVFRFLRSASRTLHLPFSVQAPSKALPQEARAVVISKQLGDFIQAYTKETHLYLDRQASASCSSLSSQCPSSLPTPSASSAHTPIDALDASQEAYSGHNLDSSQSRESDVFPSDESLSPVYNSSCSPSKRKLVSSDSLLSVSSLPDCYCYSSSPSTSIARPVPAARLPSSFRRPTASSSAPAINASSTGQGAPSSSSSSHHRRFSSDDSHIADLAGNGRDKKGHLSSSKTESEESLGKKTTALKDGVAMDLYRAFLSSAREADLEEVLSLHTRIHKSAGVFLDPARRSYTQHSSSLPPVAMSSPSGRRTSTPSPQGSPRRVRRASPANKDKNTSKEELVTTEPQPTSQSDTKPSSPVKNGQVAQPSESSGACCLFGNILKASLKGTLTPL